MEQKLIIYIVDHETGNHIDSVGFTGAMVPAAVDAARLLIKVTWHKAQKKSFTALSNFATHLVENHPMVFKFAKNKHTDYTAYCAVLVNEKSAA